MPVSRSPRFDDSRPSSKGALKQAPTSSAAASATATGAKLDELLDLAVAAAAGEGVLRANSGAASAATSGNNTAALLAMGCVDPCVTAQAIKRRKAAAVRAVGYIDAVWVLKEGVDRGVHVWSPMCVCVRACVRVSCRVDHSFRRGQEA